MHIDTIAEIRKLNTLFAEKGVYPKIRYGLYPSLIVGPFELFFNKENWYTGKDKCRIHITRGFQFLESEYPFLELEIKGYDFTVDHYRKVVDIALEEESTEMMEIDTIKAMVPSDYTYRLHDWFHRFKKEQTEVVFAHHWHNVRDYCSIKRDDHSLYMALFGNSVSPAQLHTFIALGTEE